MSFLIKVLIPNQFSFNILFFVFQNVVHLTQSEYFNHVDAIYDLKFVIQCYPLIILWLEKNEHFKIWKLQNSVGIDLANNLTLSNDSGH